MRPAWDAGPGQPFNGRNFHPLALDGKGQTRKNSFSVNQDGAGSARALITTLFRARQVEVFTQAFSRETRSSICQGVSSAIDA